MGLDAHRSDDSSAQHQRQDLANRGVMRLLKHGAGTVKSLRRRGVDSAVQQ